MKQPRPTRSAISLVAVLAAGCDLLPGAAELSPPDAPMTSSVTASLFADGCQAYGCGSNGPSLGRGIIFHELDAGMNGTGMYAMPNEAGITFLGFYDSAGGQWPLNVNGDRLQAIRNGTVVEGPGLIGWYLKLRVGPPTLPEGTNYHLIIEDVGYTGFWTGAPATVPVYKFEYKREDSPSCSTTALCLDDQGSATDDQTSFEEAAQGFRGSALIFRGDRYDAIRKTVQETGARDTRFNIGCTGTFVAKMHLLRHTLAGADPPGNVPTVPQRQAMLKMLTADYCGTGRPFTNQGVPLLYTFNQPQWARVSPNPFEPWPAWLSSGGLPWPPFAGVPKLPPPGPLTGPATPSTDTPLDAVWNQDGAVCLNTARLEHPDQNHLERLNPNIRVDIDFECEDSSHRVLKPCPASVKYDSPWSWTPSGYAISASWEPRRLPPPPPPPLLGCTPPPPPPLSGGK